LIYLFDRALAFTSHDFVTRGDRKVTAQVHPHRESEAAPSYAHQRFLMIVLAL
jgi:hypothetical protein